jgi:hypothetical protein
MTSGSASNASQQIGKSNSFPPCPLGTCLLGEFVVSRPHALLAFNGLKENHSQQSRQYSQEQHLSPHS